MGDEDKSKEALIQELEKVRTELSACQARYRTLVEHAPAITYTAVLDETSSTLYVSPQIERYLGVTQAEYVADPAMWRKLLHPEDRDRVLAEVARCHETGETLLSEYRMIARSGQVVWFRDEAALVPGQAGQPGSLQGVMVNITEQKAAQSRLNELREFNEKIISASPLGIATHRLDGRMVSANEALGQIVGSSRDAVLQQNFRELESWRQSGLLALAEEAISTGTPQRQVFHLTTTFGRDVWLDCRFNLFDASGETYLLMIVNDITALKQIETELKRHRDHLEDLVEERTRELKQAHGALKTAEGSMRALLNAITESAFLMDLSGTCLAINKTTAQRLGVSVDEVLGRNIYQFISPDLAASRARQVAEIVSTRAPIRFEDVRNERVIDQVVYPTFDASGEVNGIAVFGMDVTGRKNAEDALRQRTEDLERANQELEHFAFVASHDLKEPLRKIANFTGLIEKRYRGKLDEKADQYIQYVVDGAARLEGLIDDLLTYSRVGRAELVQKPVSMELVVRQVMEDLQRAIEESGAAITCDPLPVVQGNERQLGQLLQNLFANAIKFRGEDPPAIHMAVRRQEGEWVFSIRDNGIGFDPQHQEQIFEIFRRLQSAMEYPGTGIGLAVCKKIVGRHGGRIWAESEPGKGSTFYFTLPA